MYFLVGQLRVDVGEWLGIDFRRRSRSVTNTVHVLFQIVFLQTLFLSLETQSRLSAIQATLHKPSGTAEVLM
jgi:hypothetical protein